MADQPPFPKLQVVRNPQGDVNEGPWECSADFPAEVQTGWVERLFPHSSRDFNDYLDLWTNAYHAMGSLLDQADSEMMRGHLGCAAARIRQLFGSVQEVGMSIEAAWRPLETLDEARRSPVMRSLMKRVQEDNPGVPEDEILKDVIKHAEILVQAMIQGAEEEVKGSGPGYL